eukprot:scaffold12431_cov94-Cyclotella_meneghiniana.AAC.5
MASTLSTIEHRNQEATCYVGNLDPQVTEDLLVELFTQIGRVTNVHMPKDKLTGLHGGYGFIEFLDVIDADYAITIMTMVKLYGRPLRVSKSSLDKKTGTGSSLDVGANLFIGNLDPNDVDDKLLYDTFSAFGTIVRPPKIMRDDMTNQSKGFGFVSYDSFEASDLAIECMHNQYLCNRQITVQYAFKKGSTEGGEVAEGGKGPGGMPERHGSRAERMLAAANPHRTFLATKTGLLGERGVQKVANTMFATSAGQTQQPAPPVNSMPPPPPIPPPLPPPPMPPQQNYAQQSMQMPYAQQTMQMPPPPPPPMANYAYQQQNQILPPPPPPPPPPMQ